MSDKLPVVGDVIRSIRFVYGYRGYEDTDKRIHVGTDRPQHYIERHMTDAEIEKHVLETGRLPKSQWVTEDYGRSDLSRAKAEFVVIEARYQGGGSSQGDPIGYPDGWHVVAKRLDEGRVWNPDGEEIDFYMTGSFINLISPKKVLVVGKMTVSFT